jgi:hypothetical protein
VTNVAAGLDGSIWYSYGDFSFHRTGGGLYRVVSGQTSREAPWGEADLNVQTLRISPSGAVWIGAGCRLGYYDGHAWTEVVADCDPLAGNVIDIDFGSDGDAWIATGFSLGRLTGGVLERIERLANWTATTPDGAVWISAWEGAAGTSYVARFDGEEWILYPADELSGSGGSKYFGAGQIAAAPDGVLWGVLAGYDEWQGPRTFEGLVSFDGSEWLLAPAPAELRNATPGQLQLAPDGTPWIVTDGRLAYLKESAWQVVEADSVPISAIAFALDGRLWTGRADGSVSPFVVRYGARAVQRAE